MDNTVFVRAVFDLYGEISLSMTFPVYRIYLDNELFAEREWRWTEHYTEEILQIQAPPGRYRLRIESTELYVQDSHPIAQFPTRNHRVEHGPARWLDSETLEILPCEPENL